MKKISDKRKLQLEANKIANVRQRTVFLHIWKNRDHISEISGKWLGREALSTFFHHILPKERYPEARYDEENIILLTFDEHQKVESDCEFFEEINKRREKLYERYNKNNILE